MDSILKKELAAILNLLLEKSLTPENLEWLEKHRKAFWKDYRKYRISEWASIYDKIDLSFRIQDILDAKAGRIELNYRWGEGLPKLCVLELAQLLNLAVTEKTPKRQIINLILKTIEE